MDKKQSIKQLVDNFTDFWKTKSDEQSLWEALAKSYFDQEHELNQKQLFITQISFYPKLISNLVDVLKDMSSEKGKKVSLEITFFSTLLPRHYWNFPVMYKNDDNIYPIAVDFLDKYRTLIDNCVNKKNGISIIIKRIIFLAANKSVKNKCKLDYKLFSLDEFLEDFNYCCPDNNKNGKIKWSTIMKKYKDHYAEFLNNYLLDNKDELIAELVKKKKDESFPQEWENGKFYLLKKKQNEQLISVGEYYLNQLHSKGIAENAKYIVVYDDDNEHSDKDGYCPYTLLSNISLDLSYLKIMIDDNEPNSYILNTFMDIKQGIVKLQLIEVDENNENAINLSNQIDEIIGVSRSIKQNITDINKAKNILRYWKGDKSHSSAIIDKVLKLIESPNPDMNMIKLIVESRGGNADQIIDKLNSYI